jgi:hypothetical protein
MITKEFCEQYVSLIPNPYRFLTEVHMIRIVKRGEHVPAPFDEKGIIELSRNNRIAPQIYMFITQNQHLWVDNKVETV